MEAINSGGGVRAERGPVLLLAGRAGPDSVMARQHAAVSHLQTDHEAFCKQTLPAPASLYGHVTGLYCGGWESVCYYLSTYVGYILSWVV